MKKLLLLTAVAAVALSTPLAARDWHDTACVRQDEIRNYTVLNDKRVVVENYRHQKVLLKLIGTCSDLQYDQALEIRSRGTNGLSCIAQGDTVISRGPGIGGRCAIVSVTPFYGDMHRHDRDHDDNNDNNNNNDRGNDQDHGDQSHPNHDSY